jgi:hypothetical protein
MSTAKAKLKQIQKSLKEEQYDDVVSQTKELLKEEKGQGSSVYNALVFAGVALTKLGRVDEAEKVSNNGMTAQMLPAPCARDLTLTAR